VIVHPHPTERLEVRRSGSRVGRCRYTYSGPCWRCGWMREACCRRETGRASGRTRPGRAARASAADGAEARTADRNGTRPVWSSRRRVRCRDRRTRCAPESRRWCAPRRIWTPGRRPRSRRPRSTRTRFPTWRSPWIAAPITITIITIRSREFWRKRCKTGRTAWGIDLLVSIYATMYSLVKYSSSNKRV